MTKSSDTWTIEKEEIPEDEASSEEPPTPGIIDIHSGSKAKALDGTLYSEW